MKSKVTNSASLGEAVSKLEKLARRDPGNRGLSSQAPTGRLGPAAFDLLSGRRVAIVTGFCVRSTLTGETDGPSGALALAAALRILGKKVVLVSDRYSLPLLRTGSKILKLAFRMLELPESQEDADVSLRAFIASFKPTHVLALERPGNASDGHRYSMRGDILDDIAPSADILFTKDTRRGYATLAIGDGGNELGMGSLRAEFMSGVAFGDKIFCASPADHTIVAGISNWGGYALTAVLSLLSGALLLNTVEKEREVLSALVEAGAVDGCTRERTVSVDGLPWDEYSETLKEMRDMTSSILDERRSRTETGGKHDD